MKKLILLSTILIFNAYQLSSQTGKNVIYLKNGSIIYGTITEISGDQYKFKGKDGSLFVFPAAEVDKYVKETPLFDGRKSSGVGLSLEAGFLFGSQESSEYIAPFSFNTIIHYTYETKNDFGLGSGAEFLGRTYVPLYFEFRRIFYDRKSTPFFFGRAGMLFSIGGEDENGDIYYPQNNSNFDYHGGPSVTAGTGISWAGDDLETYITFAYRFAQTGYKVIEYNSQETTYTTYWNRLEIKFGFKF